MSQATWNMKLNAEQVDRSMALRKQGQTQDELMTQIYELGLYQLEYRQGPTARAARKAYQQKRNAEVKLAMQLMKDAQKDPEKAVALGIGTRVAL